MVKGVDNTSGHVGSRQIFWIAWRRAFGQFEHQSASEKPDLKRTMKVLCEDFPRLRMVMLCDGEKVKSRGLSMRIRNRRKARSGWNPSEELANAVNLEEIADELDDLQISTWQAIQGDRWSATYWASVGAIAQIAVYPSRSDLDVAVEDGSRRRPFSILHLFR